MITRKLSSEGPKVNVRDVEKLKKLRASSTPLRERLIEDLRFHHFSDGTISQYLSELLHLAAHYWRSPAALTDDDLRSYFNYLQNDCGYSGSSMGVTHAALIFFLWLQLSDADAVSAYIPAETGQKTAGGSVA